MEAKHKRTKVAVAVLALAGLLWILSLSMAGDLKPPATPASMAKKPEGVSVNTIFAGAKQDQRILVNGPDQLPDRISQHEAWVDVFSEFNEGKDELMSQFEDAKHQYPDLVLAFRLVATYSNFLELRVRNLTRIRGLGTATDLPPVMDLDHRFRKGIFPPDICPPNPYPTPPERWGITMDELREMLFEEKLKRFGQPFEVIESCDEIREKYQETLDRLTELYKQRYLTSEELDELYQCIDKLKELTDKLITNGCIMEIGIIVEPNLTVKPVERVRE